jgi:hypothetical protein
MLIELLIKKHQLRLQQCTERYQQDQRLRCAYLWLLQQLAKQFLSSAPGLAISFTAGMLMPLRHHSAIKMLRRSGALHWLRQLWLTG